MGKICMLRWLVLKAYQLAYALARPLIFRGSAQQAHEQLIALLRRSDNFRGVQAGLRLLHQVVFMPEPITIGGVHLPYPLMLAAGFVKGDGFASEDAACAAVEQGQNIIPGWRSMPQMVGVVEFGSFTRWPREGNPGTVMWRDAANRSTQNRVGLKNPGARAAASFLARKRTQLPVVYGINIAVSPGVTDAFAEQREVVEALDFFLRADLQPAWFTLNVSCPNTEDDPGGHQTEERTRQLCMTIRGHIPPSIPLWIKISPDLAAEQYRILMRVFAETGISAVIATNTLGQPTPLDATIIAGVGGARLHQTALKAAELLMQEKQRHDYAIDVIGCGGVQDGQTYQHFQQLGIKTVQYWSALVFRGPLAAAIIKNEVDYV